MSAVGDVDSPVRVVVTPSQSSYFAGEPFTVTITFTNTRTAEPGPSRTNPHSHHKRGAHSISSAPLARPPTSPGTPRSAVTPSLSRAKGTDELPRRKGFIGKSKPQPIPDLMEQRRMRQLAHKSLSVSISPFELENTLAEASSSAPYSQRSFHDSRAHVPSPLARTDALPLASDHPHARKQSVLDGQLSLDVLSPTTSVPPSPYTPSSSTSTFSLALDPIAEAAHSPYPSTPALGSPTIEPASFPPPHTPTAPSNSVYAYPPARSGSGLAPHRPAPIGIGLGQPSTRAYPQHPRSAFASTFPPHNTELILYSYAQLTGTLQLTPVPGALPSPAQAHTLGQLRAALLTRAVLGGGSMDIGGTLHPGSPHPPSPALGARAKQTHSRASSFSAGILSILSPTSLVSPPPSSGLGRTRWRASSGTFGAPRLTGSASVPSGVALGSVPGPEIDPDVPLPTYEIQPAMLAVDLALGPGESRSYTYTVKLPDNLPPTFKGKALKFAYELVVGTCRAGPPSANNISRVMKVPIRVYNHVSVNRALKPYDLLWPVNRRQDAGMPGTEATVVEHPEAHAKEQNHTAAQLPSPSPVFPPSNTLGALRDYARSLLASLPDPVDDKEDLKPVDAESPSPSSSSSSSSLESTSSASVSVGAGAGAGEGEGIGNGHGNGHGHGHGHGQTDADAKLEQEQRARRADQQRQAEQHEKAEDGGLSGCREAVEILTRNPKKASYDVNKDGVRVAVLTFTKAAYRLGETISGVVELNERTSRARVVKLSAILESHETLPSTVSPASSARHLRRAYAEFHASFTLNTLRTAFSLDIPSDASPAFQIRVGTQASPQARSPPNSAPAGATTGAAPTPGGLEWKVRLCLLVGIAAESSAAGALTPGVRFKSLVRDGPRGEWGASWHATPRSAPLEKPNLKAELEAEKQRMQPAALASPRMWSRFLVSSILYGNLSTDSEREYHDGDIMDDDEEAGRAEREAGYDGIIPDLGGGVGVGVDYGGGEDGWREVRLETVECEVPVKVFPGNTAFKALDVVFDV